MLTGPGAKTVNINKNKKKLIWIFQLFFKFKFKLHFCILSGMELEFWILIGAQRSGSKNRSWNVKKSPTAHEISLSFSQIPLEMSKTYSVLQNGLHGASTTTYGHPAPDVPSARHYRGPESFHRPPMRNPESSWHHKLFCWLSFVGRNESSECERR